MRSLPALRRNATIVLVLLGLAGSAAAQAGAPVKPRTSKVTIFDCTNGKPVIDPTGKQFALPWTLVGDKVTDAGLLTVRGAGEPFCVRAYAVSVETDKALALPKVDCDAKVAAAQPRSGATRGVGEECGNPKSR
jgi:hypothetical protein